MRRIDSLLLACSLLVNTPSVADVESIRIRFDANGRITGVSSSLMTGMMSLTTPSFQQAETAPILADAAPNEESCSSGYKKGTNVSPV